MTEQETKDLEEMKAKIVKMKENLFDYLNHLDKSNDEALAMSGYRNGNADAMRRAFQSTEKDIHKLIKLHLIKYPD